MADAIPTRPKMTKSNAIDEIENDGPSASLPQQNQEQKQIRLEGPFTSHRRIKNRSKSGLKDHILSRVSTTSIHLFCLQKKPPPKPLQRPPPMPWTGKTVQVQAMPTLKGPNLASWAERGKRALGSLTKAESAVLRALSPLKELKPKRALASAWTSPFSPPSWRSRPAHVPNPPPTTLPSDTSPQ